MYQPRGVMSLAYMDINSLLEVKNSITRDYLKDIWNRQFKTLVKMLTLEYPEQEKEENEPGFV